MYKTLISNDKILKIAAETLREEAHALIKAAQNISENFKDVVHLIYNSKGRVIVTGIGKSAIVGQKTVATLNSTGTPAVFMHAADAIHGDLGIVQKNDVVICISNSGNTPEIKVLSSLIKEYQFPLVAITGNPDSELGKKADFIINSKVDKEACPHNLAPTSSTTVQMALGDALAMCLLELRQFSAEDFAKFHPGGHLGKMFLRLSDFSEKNEKPSVSPDTPLQDVIIEISSKRLGATAVVNNNNELLGIITDGDIRRLLQKTSDLKNITAKDIMNTNPKSADHQLYAIDAIKILKSNNISQLIVTNENKYGGMVHFHDFLKEGIL